MLPKFVDNNNKVSDHYDKKLQFISHVAPIDYRDKEQQQKEKPAVLSEIQQRPQHPRTQPQEHHFQNSKPQQISNKITNNSKQSLNDAKQAFLQQHERTYPTNKLPWVKYDDEHFGDDDDDDDEEEEEISAESVRNRKTTPKREILSARGRSPHDDSDDSFAHTTDESLIEEYQFSSINSATSSNGSTSSLNGNHSGLKSHDNSRLDKIATLESSQIEDLIATQFAMHPRTEREVCFFHNSLFLQQNLIQFLYSFLQLWKAFHDQRGIILKLKSDLDARTAQCNELQTQLKILQTKQQK